MVENCRDLNRVTRSIEFGVYKFKDPAELKRDSLRLANVLKVVSVDRRCHPVEPAPIPWVRGNHPMDPFEVIKVHLFRSLMRLRSVLLRLLSASVDFDYY